MVPWKQSKTGSYCPIDGTEIYAVEEYDDPGVMCLYCKCDYEGIDLKDSKKIREKAVFYLANELPKILDHEKDKLKGIKKKIGALELIIHEAKQKGLITKN